MLLNPRRFVSICVVLAALAFAIRIAMIFYRSNFEPQVLNECARIGAALATRGDFADPYILPTGLTAHCSPLQPALIALFYRIFGITRAGEMARQVYNSGLISLTVGLLPWLAVRLGLSAQTGFLGALLLCFPVGPIEYETHWEAPLLQLIVVVFTATHYKLEWLSRWPLALCMGIVWGLVILLNQVMLVLLLTFLVARFRQIQWRQAAALLVLAFLVMVPWMIRNHSVFGQWFLVRSNLGLEIFLGAADDARPTYVSNLPRLVRYHPNASPQMAEEIQKRGERAVFKEMATVGERWIVAHPGKYARLCLGRLIYMIVPDDLDGRRYQYPVVLVSLLSIVGWLFLLAARPGLAIWLGAVTGSLLCIYILIGQVNWRYRMPSYALSALLAAYTLNRAIQLVRWPLLRSPA
jgi:hypothetical protein